VFYNAIPKWAIHTKTLGIKVKKGITFIYIIELGLFTLILFSKVSVLIRNLAISSRYSVA
jgi:hypothetical protein